MNSVLRLAQLSRTEKKSFLLDKGLVHLYDWYPARKCTYSEFSQPLWFNNGSSMNLFTHMEMSKLLPDCSRSGMFLFPQQPKWFAHIWYAFTGSLHTNKYDKYEYNFNSVAGGDFLHSHNFILSFSFVQRKRLRFSVQVTGYSFESQHCGHSFFRILF